MRKCALVALAAAFATLPGTAVAAQDVFVDFPAASTMGGLLPPSDNVGPDMQLFASGDLMNPTIGNPSALNTLAAPFGDFDDIQFTPAVVFVPAVVVPEPTTLALMFSGLVALSLLTRRRRRA